MTPSSPIRRPRLAVVLHPAWLASLAMLAVNDHLLKGAGVLPGWLTGKLSDFAGLFVAPVLLVALLGVRSRGAVTAIHVLVGSIFAAVQLVPAAAEALAALMTGLGRPWQLWPDVSDLVALPVLVLAWLLCTAEPKRSSNTKGYSAARRSAAWLACAVGAFFCIATSDVDREPRTQDLPDADLSTPPPACGDGRLDANEQCDDGNSDAEDGCTACVLDAPFCFDGRRWLDWDCEQPDFMSPTVCARAVCSPGDQGGVCGRPQLEAVVDFGGRWTADAVPPHFTFEASQRQCACTPSLDGSQCAATCRFERTVCEPDAIVQVAPVDDDIVPTWFDAPCEGERCRLDSSTAPQAVLDAPSGILDATLVPALDLLPLDAVLQPDGKRVILARYHGNVELGGLSLGSDVGRGALVLYALGEHGEVAWARALGDPLLGTVEPHGLAVDPVTGALAVGVRLEGRLRHGAQELSAPLLDAPLVKGTRYDDEELELSEARPLLLGFAADGTPTWSRDLSSSARRGLRALEVARDTLHGRWLAAATFFDAAAPARDVSEILLLDDEGGLEARHVLENSEIESLLVRGVSLERDRLVLAMLARIRGTGGETVVVARLGLDGEGAPAWQDAILPESNLASRHTARPFGVRWPLADNGDTVLAVVPDGAQSSLGALYGFGSGGGYHVAALEGHGARLAVQPQSSDFVLAVGHAPLIGERRVLTVSRLAADGSVLWHERLGGVGRLRDYTLGTLLVEPASDAVVIGARFGGTEVWGDDGIDGSGAVEVWLAP